MTSRRRPAALLAALALSLASAAAARSMRPHQPELVPAALAFTADGAAVHALGSWGKRIRIDAASGRWDFEGEVPQPQSHWKSIVLHPDGGVVAARSGYDVVRWGESPSTAPPLLISGGDKPIKSELRALACDADRSRIVVINTHGWVQQVRDGHVSWITWQGLPTPEQQRRNTSGQWPTALTVDPKGSLVAVGFEDGTVRLADSVHEPARGEGLVDALAFSTDGSRLAVARGTTLSLYAPVWVRSGGPRLRFVNERSMPARAKRLAWLPDGERLVTVHEKAPARVVSTEDPEAVVEVGTPGAGVRALAISPDGDRVALTEGYYGLALYDTATGTPTTVVFAPQDDDGALPWAPGKGPKPKTGKGWLGGK